AAKIDDDDEDLPRKQKSLQQKLKRRYEKGDPTVGLLGEPSGKFDYYVLYPKAEPSQPPSPHKPPSQPPHINYHHTTKRPYPSFIKTHQQKTKK
nr:putative zinc finger, CCHC-type [Tanacetum cinerariifolium]